MSAEEEKTAAEKTNADDGSQDDNDDIFDDNYDDDEFYHKTEQSFDLESDDETSIEFRRKTVFTYDREMCRYFTYDRFVLDGIASRLVGQRVPPECTAGYTFSDAVRYCYVNKLSSSNAMQVLKEANPTHYDAMQSCKFVETREYTHKFNDGAVLTEKAQVYTITFADKQYQVFVEERTKPLAFTDSADRSNVQVLHSEFDVGNCGSGVVNIYVRLAEQVHHRPMCALTIYGRLHEDDPDEKAHQKKFVRFEGEHDLWNGFDRVACAVADVLYGDLRMRLRPSTYSLTADDVYYWNEGSEPKSSWEREKEKDNETLARKKRTADRANGTLSWDSEEQQYLDNEAEKCEQEAEKYHLEMQRMLEDWKGRQNKKADDDGTAESEAEKSDTK